MSALVLGFQVVHIDFVAHVDSVCVKKSHAGMIKTLVI